MNQLFLVLVEWFHWICQFILNVFYNGTLYLRNRRLLIKPRFNYYWSPAAVLYNQASFNGLPMECKQVILSFCSVEALGNLSQVDTNFYCFIIDKWANSNNSHSPKIGFLNWLQLMPPAIVAEHRIVRRIRVTFYSEKDRYELKLAKWANFTQITYLLKNNMNKVVSSAVSSFSDLSGQRHRLDFPLFPTIVDLELAIREHLWPYLCDWMNKMVADYNYPLNLVLNQSALFRRPIDKKRPYPCVMCDFELYLELGKWKTKPLVLDSQAVLPTVPSSQGTLYQRHWDVLDSRSPTQEQQSKQRQYHAVIYFIVPQKQVSLVMNKVELDDLQLLITNPYQFFLTVNRITPMTAKSNALSFILETKRAVLAEVTVQLK